LAHSPSGSTRSAWPVPLLLSRSFTHTSTTLPFSVQEAQLSLSGKLSAVHLSLKAWTFHGLCNKFWRTYAPVKPKHDMHKSRNILQKLYPADADGRSKKVAAAFVAGFDGRLPLTDGSSRAISIKEHCVATSSGFPSESQFRRVFRRVLREGGTLANGRAESTTPSMPRRRVLDVSPRQRCQGRDQRANDRASRQLPVDIPPPKRRRAERQLCENRAPGQFGDMADGDRVIVKRWQGEWPGRVHEASSATLTILFDDGESDVVMTRAEAGRLIRCGSIVRATSNGRELSF
jgi:hypothetical protein